MNRERIYADHAATTTVREEVARDMLAVMTDDGYNPSSLHAEGRRSRARLDDARERVARVLGASPREIVFTGGGSESDNLAIRGATLAAARARGIARPHVVTVATEHHAVLHAVEALAEDGVDATILSPGAEGLVDLAAFEAALEPGRTVLASVMLANNETGTVQPVAALAAAARRCGVLFHCDAVQAPGRLPIDVRRLGADLVAISAHKFYGPKGAGALYVRADVALAPQIHGGGQEAGRRAGTENTAGIAGLAHALELAEAERPAEAVRLAALRDGFEAAVLALVDDVRVTGAGAERLPNLSSLALRGAEAGLVLARLDLGGAAVSAGSACAAGAIAPSHVLEALGLPPWALRSTIRFSFGRSNGEQEVADLARMLANIVMSLREAAPLSGHTPERF